MKTIKAIVRLTERDRRRVDLINFQAARIEELERQVAQQKIELEWYEAEACKKDASLVALLEANERMAAELDSIRLAEIREGTAVPRSRRETGRRMTPDTAHKPIGTPESVFQPQHEE